MSATNLGWMAGYAYKAKSIIGTNGDNSPSLVAESTLTGDFNAHPSITNTVAHSAVVGTGLAIKRTIVSGDDVTDFRFYIGGTTAHATGFRPALIIKEMNHAGFLHYNSSSNISFGTFTGTHLSKIKPGDVLESRADDLIGRIVSSEGSYSTIDHINNVVLDNNYEGVTINDPIQ